MESIVVAFVVSLGINFTMFLLAYKLQSDKLTDASYAITFLTLAAYGLINSSGGAYHVLLATMVAVWAFRLGGFLLYRVVKAGKDKRFDGMRESFVKFGTFWLIQAVSVWVLMIPSVMAFELPIVSVPLAALGLIIWLAGFCIESIADAQKYKFSTDQANTGRWATDGIWK
jgi:steroid 5-alpha reductase family enzyme